MMFDIINSSGDANIVLICEHASNHIPQRHNNLGLSAEQLKLHIAWDIGIAEVTKKLAHTLNAPAILARFSRLLIDANRALDQKGLIPERSDNIEIPGNQNLSQKDISHRINKYYTPFHQKTDQLIQLKAKNVNAPLIINMHSFTPVMNGTQRPWQIGMLWNKDPRIAQVLIKTLTEKGFNVGDNQPYSGQKLNHTMNTHGTNHGFAHVNIEIRQDEIDHIEGVKKWSTIIAEELLMVREMPDMGLVKHY
jgi:predicted N-formylglutamate amidohydrolase